MFKIMQGDKTIAIVEKLHFICASTSGCYIKTDETNAQGIAVNGTPYNLSWCESLKGVKESVNYVEIDGGEYISELQTQVTEAQLALVELYEGVLSNG